MIVVLVDNKITKFQRLVDFRLRWSTIVSSQVGGLSQIILWAVHDAKIQFDF